MKTFEIFYSDLTPTAQKQFLDFLGVKDPKEANLDMDIIPIATYEVDNEA